MNGSIVTRMILLWVAAGFGATTVKSDSQLAANQAEFANDRARVVVSIQSNVYTYDVTNLGESAIKAFEVTQHAAYNFKAPDDWQIDESRHLFKADANTPAARIEPGRVGQFSMRVSSEGAVLGRGTVRLMLASGENVLLEDVLAPVAEPPGHLLIVAATILLIVLGHSAFLIWRKSRAGKGPVSA